MSKTFNVAMEMLTRPAHGDVQSLLRSRMDHEITAGLPQEHSCAAVLDTLQHLAAHLGAQMIAEGVERPNQLATLRHHGVGIAQGNLLGPPQRRPATHLPIRG